MSFPLQIIRDDGPLLACNKPAGLATQAPTPFPSLETEVKAWLKERFAKPGNVYLGVPHRLDRPVSGIVVFARNSKAAARLAEQFAERRVTKIYRAIVEGELPDESGILRDHVKKVPDAAQAAIASADDEAAREAVLTYRVLERLQLGERGAPATHVEITLGTGRMHQIRIQFASRGFPVVGDAKYGAAMRWDPAAETWAPSAATCSTEAVPGEDPIALHARSLTLFHPIRYDELTLEATLPAAWERLRQ